MQLVAKLRSRREQSITMHQALRQLGIDLWWWCPRPRMESRTEFGQRLGEGSIGLGAFEQRFGEIVSLGRVDDRDGEASFIQALGQAHPVGASRFHDDEHSAWVGLN